MDRLAAYLLGVTFLAAAGMKVLRPEGFRTAMLVTPWIPETAKGPVYALVPTAELVLGITLLLAPGVQSLAWAGLMLLIFTGYLIINFFSGGMMSCNCFGGETILTPQRSTVALPLARNLALLCVAGLGVLDARRVGGPGPLLRNSLVRVEASRRRWRGRGFTLTELLLVIGLVGVLIGLLLPALSRVRAHGQATACLANLRQIGQMAHAWAASHEGFMPLAGDVWVLGPDAGPPDLPARLADPSRRRYAYAGDRFSQLNGPEWVVPFDVALLSESSGRDATEWQTSMDWERDVERVVKAARVFRCPASFRSSLLGRGPGQVLGVYTLTLMSGTYGQYAPWPVTHDYALNGGFLGFSYDPAHGARRLRGRIAAARMSSTVVLAGDTASVGIIWQPTLVAERPADLADVLTRNHAQVIGTTSGAYYAGFHGRDAVHKSGMNVLFVDGHAEYVSARVPDLQRCRLTN